jgi:elongation factor G
MEGKAPPGEIGRRFAKPLSRAICPILCGSAAEHRRPSLLDAVDCFGPKIEEGPLAALAFKIFSDRHNKLTYVRVYKGTLSSGSYVLNSTRGHRERVGRLVEMHANKPIAREYLKAGEIGAVIGFDKTLTGDTICDEDHPIVLEAIEFPAPVISVSISRKPAATRQALLGLAKLAEEDPTFVVSFDHETRRSHPAWASSTADAVDHLSASTASPRRSAAPGDLPRGPRRWGRSRPNQRQTGSRRLRPRPSPASPSRGRGHRVRQRRQGGNVPKEYIPAVERASSRRCRRASAAFPIVGIRVAGGRRLPTSIPASARSTPAHRWRSRSSSVRRDRLLEPVMMVNVISPSDHGPDGDLMARRGQIEAMEPKGVNKEIRAFVPLSGMFGYATQLRTLSRGTATFSMTFDHYEKVPFSLAEDIVASRAKIMAGRRF